MIEKLMDSFHLEKGDTILFASDVMKLMWLSAEAGKEFDLNNLIDELQNKIGAEGNILFPTYNWDFCRGITWNYHKTKSKTGTLTQLALKRKDFIRTRHPIYSFAVWGKDSERLYKMHDKNSFVGDTPFDFLCKAKNSKMICLDVNLTHCFTFVHYVEEIFQVPYRFLKNFTAQYIDENNNESTRTYSMFVRYLDRKVDVDFTGLENQLLEQSKMYKENIDGVTVWSFKFKDSYDIMAKDFEQGIYKNVVQLD